MARTFAVIRDQDGDQKDTTLKEWGELQGQGYRLLDLGGYDLALSEGIGPEPAAETSPAAAAMADQGGADASAATADQYPEAKPAAADKPAARKK